MSEKDNEIQSFEGRKDTKEFYDALKTVYGPKSPGTTLRLSVDGNTQLSLKGGPNTSTVYSVAHHLPMTIQSTDCHRWGAMYCLVNSHLSLKQRKQFGVSHRARSQGQTYLQIYTAGDQPMAEKLTELFQCMWRKEDIPPELKDVFLIHLHKPKENPVTTIFILSVAGKILSKILLNRFNKHFGQTGLLADSQYAVQEGHMKNRHGLYIKATPRVMPRTKCEPIHDLCRRNQSN